MDLQILLIVISTLIVSFHLVKWIRTSLTFPQKTRTINLLAFKLFIPLLLRMIGAIYHYSKGVNEINLDIFASDLVIFTGGWIMFITIIQMLGRLCD